MFIPSLFFLFIPGTVLGVSAMEDPSSIASSCPISVEVVWGERGRGGEVREEEEEA